MNRSEPSEPALRLPDFIIIGAMKSGTTSLFRWLGQHPDICEAARKEPRFFSHEEPWEKGPVWYSRLFDCPSPLTGEASVTYTDPVLAARSASRMYEMIPQAKLIYLLRDPVERLRSHYRHQVQRGREQLPFDQAVSEVGSEYVRYSLYYTALEPYIDKFPRDQIQVVRSEDIFGSTKVWFALLDYLGVSQHPVPTEAHNVGAEKRQFTPVLRWIWEKEMVDRFVQYLPKSVRTLGKAALTRNDSHYRQLLAGSRTGSLEPSVARRIWSDVDRLEAWLGADTPLWARRGG